MKTYWVIEVYEGTRMKSQHVIQKGLISDNNIKYLLQLFAAKNGLTEEEIIPCYLNKNTRKYSNHLEIEQERNGRYYNFYCHGAVDVSAIVVPEDELSDILEVEDN